jgi:hypothetical protein
VIAFHDIVCFSEIDSRFANSKTSLNAALKEVSNILSDKNPNNEESAYCKLGALINQANADTTLALLLNLSDNDRNRTQINTVFVQQEKVDRVG